MEDADAREGIRLLTQIHETQVANLEVQRKLLELVAAQGARNDEASKRFIERSTVLQDRTMDMLVFNRRVLSFAAPVLAVLVVFLLWAFWLRVR